MDFHQAETRFRQLQENCRNGAVTKEAFLQAVSQLMVQDSTGQYWAIEAKTGEWLYYDGHVWQKAVQAGSESTQKIQSVAKRRRGGGWFIVLLVGSALLFGFLIAAGLLTYRMWGGTSLPEVPILSTPTVSESNPVHTDIPPVPKKQEPTLTILKGGAEIRLSGSESWMQVDNNASVQPGQAVRTSSDGRSQFVFAEGIVAELGESTELLLEQMDTEAGGLLVIRLMLPYGDTWHRLDTHGVAVRYEIKTPSALVTLHGTLVHMVTQRGGVTLIEVAEGDAFVTAAEQTRQVLANQRVRVDPGAPPIVIEEAASPVPGDSNAETVACRHDAALIADVSVPPGAVLQPGQKVDKIWRMRNTGTCPWVDSTWAFVSGDRMGSPADIVVPRTEPGGTFDISVPLQAPLRAGSYAGIWQLKDSAGKEIGQAVEARIRVSVMAEPAASLTVVVNVPYSPPYY